MKRILILLFAFFHFEQSYAQFFEGTLTYKVDFEFHENFGFSKEEILTEMKKRGEYSDTIIIKLKNGNYLRKTNSSLETKEIYRSDSNKIFTFSKEIGLLHSMDAKQYELINILNLEYKKPMIQLIDTTKIINGVNCNLFKFTYDDKSEEYYFFNSDIVKIDANLFKNHNYQNLNMVLENTKSYPFEFIYNTNSFLTSRMSLLSIKSEKINDDIFDINKVTKEYEQQKRNNLTKKIEFYKNNNSNWNQFGNKKTGYTVEHPENWAVKGSEGMFYSGLKEGFENSEFTILIGKLKDKERIDFIIEDEMFYEGYYVVEKPIEVNGIKGTYYLRTHKDKPEKYYESVVLKTKTHMYNISNSGYNNNWFEYFYKSFKPIHSHPKMFLKLY